MRSSTLLVVLTVAVALGAGAGRSAAGDSRPMWPDEQEQRLNELNTELRDARRARFDALFFSTDQAEKDRLTARVRAIKKERAKLLGARPDF